jgi:hypothetical protein
MRLCPAAWPATQPVARGRPIVLIGLVGAALDVELALEPLRRQHQALAARARDRVRMAPAVRLELALALPQPPLAPLCARHDPLHLALERHLLGRLGLRFLGVGVIAAKPLPGPAEEVATSLRRAQLLGQLIAALFAIELILSLVGRPRLGHDLPGDLIEGEVDLRARVARDARAVDRDDAPPHQPRRSHSLSTSPNRSDNARSWRQIKRAIVA